MAAVGRWARLRGVVELGGERTPPLDQTAPGTREPANGTASSRVVLRLLGRLLGDVIRETQGQATFDQIEQIRSRSVGEHRRGETDAGLGALLQALPLKDMLLLIRGFSLFFPL